MYNSIPFTLVTANTTNLTPLGGGSESSKIAGYHFLNTSATADMYVKFYWGVQGAVPVVGTTVPNLTVAVPATCTAPAAVGQVLQNFSNPMLLNGTLWMAVTANPVSTDTTAVAAGQGILTVLLQN